MNVNGVSERLPHERNELLRSTGHRVRVSAHPPAHAEFHSFRLRLFYQFLQVFDLLLGRRVPPPTGHVDGHVLPQDLSQQRPNWLPRNSPKHVQDRELHPRLRAPQGQTIELVVVIPAVKLPEQIFQIARVLTRSEERRVGNEWERWWSPGG